LHVAIGHPHPRSFATHRPLAQRHVGKPVQLTDLGVDLAVQKRYLAGGMKERDLLRLPVVEHQEVIGHRSAMPREASVF
jgi:hypothetical protein